MRLHDTLICHVFQQIVYSFCVQETSAFVGHILRRSEPIITNNPAIWPRFRTFLALRNRARRNTLSRILPQRCKPEYLRRAPSLTSAYSILWEFWNRDDWVETITQFLEFT
jgi:hypothetical protein